MLIVISPARTIGEQRFEQYLETMRYEFEYERAFPGKSKRPDYTITRNGIVLFDVKDADPTLLPSGFSQYDPHKGAIRRINSGCEKFKEFKEFPCCIVLQNNGSMHDDIENPAIMLGAMYGKIGFKVPIYVGEGRPTQPALAVEPAFLGGAQFQPAKNTRISAVISLREIRGTGFANAVYAPIQRDVAEDETDEPHQGVIVWENVHAAMPLPRDLFDGPFDERWGLDGTDVACIFCGSELAALP